MYEATSKCLLGSKDMLISDCLFISQDLPAMVAIKDADFSNVDAVFCCLPHGTTEVSFASN